MKIGKVINLKDYGFIFDFFKRNKIIIVSSILFVAGLFLGIFSLEKFEGFFDYFNNRLKEIISLRNEGEILKIFLNSFTFNLNITVSVFIIGTSILGIVFLPFVLGGYGFYYGAIIALLYSEYDLNGILLNAIVILPTVVLFAVCIILASREAVNFSFRISELTLPKTVPFNLYYSFKKYCLKFTAILAILVFSALADGILSFYLFDKFM